MATTLKTLRWGDLAVGISIFVLAALTGCQSPQSRQASSSSLGTSSTLTSSATGGRIPAPTFDGPNVRPRAVASAKPLANPAPLTGPAAWKPRVPARDWKWIVIHHSATPTGSMAYFDKEHKAKGWDGIGYHFVIGNGTSTADGQVEVTQRWPLQKWGAHAKTADNRFNEQGIGICLVGNFDVERPSPQQMRNLSRLVSHLMHTYNIPAQNVVGHRDTKPTDCPGRYVNLASIRSSASAGLAGGDGRADATINPTVETTAEAPADLPTEAVVEASGFNDADRAQTAAGTELLMELPQ